MTGLTAARWAAAVPEEEGAAAPGRGKRRIHRELTYLSTFTVSAGVVIMFGMRSRGVSVVDAHAEDAPSGP